MTDFIRPYKEAYDYQVRRTAMVPADFFKLAEGLRPHAFTIAGLQRYDSVLAADRILADSIGTSKTMSDALGELGAVLDEQDGLLLSPQRLELIHWNAMSTAESAASYRTAMDLVEERPIFWYYGPDNSAGHTISQICLPIHKIKVRFDDPILQHMWGPNHHHEYHEWVSMTEEEAGTDLYASKDGQEYPVIDGAVIHPAPGFDFNPAESMVDDGAFAEGVASLGGIIERKASADYGLEELSNLAASSLPSSPIVTSPIGTSPAAAAARWDGFRDELGIESGDGTWALDYAGDGVRINRASFDEMIAADRDNARYLGFITPTIENPVETWWIPYDTDEGVAYAKRYIGVYQAGGKTTTVVIDSTPAGIAAGDGRTPGAWLWRMKVVDGNAEDFRKGLLVSSKVGRGRKH